MNYKLLILLLITSYARAGIFTCTDLAQSKEINMAPLLQVTYTLRPIFDGDQRIIGHFTLPAINGETSGFITGVNNGSGSLSLYREDGTSHNDTTLEGTLQIDHTGQGTLKLQNVLLSVSCEGQIPTINHKRTTLENPTSMSYKMNSPIIRPEPETVSICHEETYVRYGSAYRCQICDGIVRRCELLPY